MTQINYTQLTDVSQQTQFYGEGARMKHPSGIWYVRKDGRWQVDADQGDK